MKDKKFSVIIAIVVMIFSSVILFSIEGDERLEEEKNFNQKKSDQKRIEQIITHHRSSPIDEYKIFRSPTYPEEGVFILPEWEETKYLVLSIPYTDGFSNENITKYYADIIKHAIKYTNILILVNEDELGALNELMTNLRNLGLQDKINQNKPYYIKILQIRLNTKWIRDYGPIFGTNINKDYLYVIDPIYRDIRIVDNDTQDRNFDDELPTYISPFLQRSFKYKIKIIKPPFQLWGGDFQTDGSGNLFTSTETLIMNGANTEDFELLFKYYLGMKRVVYLQPLPGRTIKHIDMFFKIVDENTILIGEYIPDNNELLTNQNEYVRYLQDEVSLILNENYLLLKRNFPEKNIVKIPMPPMDIKIDEEVKLNFYKLLLLELLNSEGYQNYDLNNIDNMSKDEIEKMLIDLAKRSISEELDIDEQEGEIDKLLELIIKIYIKELLKQDPDACNYIYRTYLNSTFIKAENGNLLLVPGYNGFEKMEQRIRMKYHSVYPNSEIVFINSDCIIEQYGAIHCTTLTIPKLRNHN